MIRATGENFRQSKSSRRSKRGKEFHLPGGGGKTHYIGNYLDLDCVCVRSGIKCRGEERNKILAWWSTRLRVCRRQWKSGLKNMTQPFIWKGWSKLVCCSSNDPNCPYGNTFFASIYQFELNNFAPSHPPCSAGSSSRPRAGSNRPCSGTEGWTWSSRKRGCGLGKKCLWEYYFCHIKSLSYYPMDTGPSCRARSTVSSRSGSTFSGKRNKKIFLSLLLKAETNAVVKQTLAKWGTKRIFLKKCDRVSFFI